MLDIDPLQSSHILVIDSSCGGGHTTAADAIVQSLNGKCTILRLDMMTEIIPKRLGFFPLGSTLRSLWNTAQQEGNVRRLQTLDSMRHLAEWLFAGEIERKIAQYLHSYPIEYIIDTQPLGTRAILEVVKRTKSPGALQYIKVMTDFPTERATHFFDSIQTLSKAHKCFFRLVTTKPFLKNEETETQFWQRMCKLTPEEIEHCITYRPFPLRAHFAAFRSGSKLPEALTVRVHSEEECAAIGQRTGSKKLANDRLSVPIAPEDVVLTVMLSAHALTRAVKAYAQACINFVREHGDTGKTFFFFIFCGEERQLIRDIGKLIDMQSTPSNCCIVPLGKQTDEEIAPLFSRSDATITRAGGIVSMELSDIARGQLFIHADNAELDNIPLWEYGNAEYLKRNKNAQLTTPEQVKEQLIELFSQSALVSGE